MEHRSEQNRRFADELRLPFRHSPRSLWLFFRWLIPAVLTGLIAGGAGVLFARMMRMVTDFRMSHTWMIWFLPLGGLAIVGLYHLCGVLRPGGTNLVIQSVREGDDLPLIMAPLIFVSTLITHLVGGSAGREGAALQLGGSLGDGVGLLLRRNRADRVILMISGMSGAFAALFGTPLAATVLAMELTNIGVMYYAAIVPATVAAIVAAAMAYAFGVPPITFPIPDVTILTFPTMCATLLLAMGCAGVAVLFCFSLRATEVVAQKWIANQYLRALVGGVVLLGLTWLCGTYDYLGLGQETIRRAFTGESEPWTFTMKILFTSVTLAAGFRGGEIVPAMFTGATFGVFCGELMGLDASLAAGLGLISVFCGVTNAPLTSLILAMEMFHMASPTLFLLAISVSYMLSGYHGIWRAQKIVWSKTEQRHIDRSAE
ncbi:MAG: chloride channel protein [Planctomycetia bacterium]|nr:chloride channel protein [Planctomycetia bacterium]